MGLRRFAVIRDLCLASDRHRQCAVARATPRGGTHTRLTPAQTRPRMPAQRWLKRAGLPVTEVWKQCEQT